MQSKAANVDDYIAEAPDDRRAALTSLRELCLRYLPDYNEAMDFGMATYYSGDRFVAFASQKNFIALYGVASTVRDTQPELLEGLNVGKGCIRFASPKKMDFALIEKLIEIRSRAASGDHC